MGVTGLYPVSIYQVIRGIVNIIVFCFSLDSSAYLKVIDNNYPAIAILHLNLK